MTISVKLNEPNEYDLLPNATLLRAAIKQAAEELAQEMRGLGACSSLDRIVETLASMSQLGEISSAEIERASALQCAAGWYEHRLIEALCLMSLSDAIDAHSFMMDHNLHKCEDVGDVAWAIAGLILQRTRKILGGKCTK